MLNVAGERSSAGKVVTADVTNRLTLARAALAHAEECTGLRSMRERSLSAPLTDPAADDGTTLAQLPVGVTRIVDSSTVLLALTAKIQGDGWCAVLGGEDLGWCAAVELGLDLSRVVYVSTGERTGAHLLPVLGALLDGVDVLLVTASAASRLRARERRSLLARVRDREACLLHRRPLGRRPFLGRQLAGGARLSCRLPDCCFLCAGTCWRPAQLRQSPSAPGLRGR